MKVIRFILLGIVTGCCFFVKLLNETPNAETNYNTVGDGTLQVYFINLDKSTERLAHITPKMESLGYSFSRVPAVYGKSLDASYKDSVVNYSKYKRLMHNEIGNGTIGCYLSHVKTWTEFLNSNHSYALIFEDDVDFEPAKLKTLIDILVRKSGEWDMVNIDVNRHGFAKPVTRLSRLFKLVQFRSRVANTSCYIINRNAANELLKKALPIAMPVDHFTMRPWEFGIKIRGVTPQIVHQSFGDSEIAQQESKSTNIPFIYKVTSLFYQITADIMTCISAYLNIKV